MPMTPGGAGAPKDEQRSDSSGLLSRHVEPWTEAHGGAPGDGEVVPSSGAAAGGPGLVTHGTGATVSPTAGVVGVTPASTAGGHAPTSTQTTGREQGAAPVAVPLSLPAPDTGSVQPMPSVAPAARTNGADQVAPARPGVLPTMARLSVGGVSVPTVGSTAPGMEQRAVQAGLGEAAAAGEAAAQGGMMPPLGMPVGASKGDERSDSSGLLLEREAGWADPEPGGLPSETQGAPVGGTALRGADPAVPEGLPEDRVAVVPSVAATADTSAWEAADPAVLWTLGGRRAEDEEEQELMPTHVLSDDDGWSDEDDAVSEAGAGGDETESSQEADDAAAVTEEPGWSDEDGAVFAAGLGFPQLSTSSDYPSAEPVPGPGLATWRPDRSQGTAAEELPAPVTGYAGMLLSTAEVPDDEDEVEEDGGPEEDGDEAKSSRGVAHLLRQGADSWGAVPQRADEIG
ncbi:hypothetical protein [Streptomyces sp. NPDC057623]|uniref:hypothetical protein n=1 Tax=Streptomyces sp. NPDC057623 TaxID=3346187 RepID=UPI0036B1C462